MKKNNIVCLLLLLISGCSKTENIAYLDKNVITNGNLKITFSDYSSSQSSFSSNGDYHTSFEIKLLSTEPKQVNINIVDCMVYRESNNAEYSVSSTNFGDIKLECDKERSLYYSLSLPTNPEEENYHFKFKLNNNTYRFNFYYLPEDQREKYTLSYVIDGQHLENKTVLSGEKIKNYDWISDDYLYSCKELYYDENYLNKVNKEDKIASDLTVYGKKETILEFHDPGYSSYFIKNINFVPYTKEVVIPGHYNGKEIYSVLAGAFRNSNCNIEDLEKLYISKDIKSFSDVSTFEYATNLKEVHFEGNENQWKSIYKGTLPNNIKITYNSYKY